MPCSSREQLFECQRKWRIANCAPIVILTLWDTHYMELVMFLFPTLQWHDRGQRKVMTSLQSVLLIGEVLEFSWKCVSGVLQWRNCHAHSFFTVFLSQGLYFCPFHLLLHYPTSHPYACTPKQTNTNKHLGIMRKKRHKKTVAHNSDSWTPSNSWSPILFSCTSHSFIHFSD